MCGLASCWTGKRLLQGYLAHKKTPPRRTLLGLSLGPFDGPRGGGRFLMSEIPLQKAMCGLASSLTAEGSLQKARATTRRAARPAATAFRSLRFFELPT